MTRQCCMGGRRPHGLARRLSVAAPSMLSGAMLALLPKCPLCLAAWLTVVTGVGFSAAVAVWVRGLLAALWVAAVALAAMPLLRRRGGFRSILRGAGDGKN